MGTPFILQDFTNAVHHTGSDNQQHYETQAVAMGNLSEEQAFTPLARSLSREQKQHQKKIEKQNQTLLLNMLDDMKQRLSELDESLERQLEKLKEKYGDNAIEAMAQTYLNDDELHGLESDDARMKALAQKMLNADGSMKEQYKDLPEALYIRDWQEAEKLSPVVAKYEGRQSLTHNEQLEVAETAQAVGLAGSKNMVVQSSNQTVKETVDNEMDESRASLASVKTSSNLTFGS